MVLYVCKGLELVVKDHWCSKNQVEAVLQLFDSVVSANHERIWRCSILTAADADAVFYGQGHQLLYKGGAMVWRLFQDCNAQCVTKSPHPMEF